MIEIIESHRLVYAFLFNSMVIFSLLTNSLFLRFVHTLGIRKMDADTIIRWGPQTKPALGGFNFFLIFLFSIAANSMLFDPNQFFLNKEFMGMVLCVTFAFIIGLADDAYDTRPFLKLSGQIFCGLILVFSGNSITITPYEYVNYFLTIVWVVGIMNSINMLDNMDAIATVVSICIMLCCMVVIYHSTTFVGNIHFIILLGGLAALIGFLWFNWHPSKMYMGDTGSQFIGALLSVMSIIYLWNYRSVKSEEMNLLLMTRNIIIVSISFMMTITDTTVVVLNRLLKKHSPFIGGKDHTTHNLARLGYSDRAVAVVFSGMSFISVIIVSYITGSVIEWTWPHTLLFGGFFLVSLCSFFLLTHRGQRNGNKSK